jgi:hypothetical protein
MIDAFVARSQSYGAEMAADLARLGLPSVEVGPNTTVEALADACLDHMRPVG